MSFGERMGDLVGCGAIGSEHWPDPSCLNGELQEAAAAAGSNGQLFIQLLAAREPLQIRTDETDEVSRYPVICRGCGYACLLSIRQAQLCRERLDGYVPVEECPISLRPPAQ